MGSGWHSSCVRPCMFGCYPTSIRRLSLVFGIGRPDPKSPIADLLQVILFYPILWSTLLFHGNKWAKRPELCYLSRWYLAVAINTYSQRPMPSSQGPSALWASTMTFTSISFTSKGLVAILPNLRAVFDIRLRLSLSTRMYRGSLPTWLEVGCIWDRARA